MMEFQYTFTVDASVNDVTAFHREPSVLRKLTPFPIFVQVQDYEPLADGSEARFTLWFGLIPVRWHAVHSDVNANGFTDTQVSGPLKSWRHTHRFTALETGQTRVTEHIIYEHSSGTRGLFSRLLFNKPALTFLFAARRRLTRRGVAQLRAAQLSPQAS